ncbi:MAG: right-handed parallel beta-helix repeat-containing protein [Candidatus Heimdallarchaeaceae archaeon]
MNKKYNKLTYSLLLLFAGLFISSFNSISIDTIAFDSSNIPNEGFDFDALIEHPPILIDEDDDVSLYGNITGTGAIDDPFRIANLNITTSGDYCINMGGYTTKYFVIENCVLVTDTNYAIFIGKYDLMPAGTLKILNNYITSFDNHGIVMNGGTYSEISGNIINAYLTGIEVDGGHYSTVSKNNITSNIGMALNDCNATTVTRNIILNNTWHGMLISNSHDAIVTHNNCTNNAGTGFLLQNSFGVDITNNIMENNFQGMDFTGTDDCLITNNLLKNNTLYGIVTQSSAGKSKIFHNAFIDNYALGIGVSQAEDNSGNLWYNDVLLEGNYWDDWIGTGNYSIDGSANEFDLYPLGSMPIISEYSITISVMYMILAFLAIPVVHFVYKKK